VKFTRPRYQSGSLSREVRKAGPAVWISVGARTQRKEGSTGRWLWVPSNSSQQQRQNGAVETFRSTINAVNPGSARDLEAIGQAL